VLLPKLVAVANFRDVAGAGLELTDGGRMATGVVYRSAKLGDATNADVAALSDLDIAWVLDLRTPVVARRSPDPSIPGAKRELINLFDVADSPQPKLTTVAAAQAYMLSLIHI
jgi:protein-tyrosine phosphatase